MTQRIAALCKEAVQSAGDPSELNRIYGELTDAVADDDAAREAALQAGLLTKLLTSLHQHGKDTDFARMAFRLLANLVYENPEAQRKATSSEAPRPDGRAFHYAAQFFAHHTTQPDLVADILNFVPNVTDEVALDDFQDIASNFVTLLSQLKDPESVNAEAKRAHQQLAQSAARALATAAIPEPVAGQFVDGKVVPPLKRLCEMYSAEPTILVEWFRAVSNLSFTDEAAEALAEGGFAAFLQDYVKKSGRNPALSHMIALAVRTMCNMSRMPKRGFDEYFNIEELVDWIFTCVDTHPKEMPVAYMIGALSRFAHPNDNKAAFFKAKGQDKLVAALAKHMKSRHVVEQAFNAVQKLTLRKKEGDLTANQRQRYMAAAGIPKSAATALEEHVARGNTVRAIALALFALVDDGGDGRDAHIRDTVVKECATQIGAALRHNTDHEEAFKALCHVLIQMTIKADHQETLGITDAMMGVADGLRRWMKEPEPLSLGLQALVNLTNAPPNRVLALARGADDCVLEVMKTYATMPDLMAYAAQVAGSLGADPKGKVELTRKKAIEALLRICRDHRGNADTLSKTTWAMEQIMLSPNGVGVEAAAQHIDAFMKLGGPQLLCDIMTNDHPKNELLVGQCIRTLTCIVKAGEAAYDPLRETVLPALSTVITNHAEATHVLLVAFAFLSQSTMDAGTHRFYSSGRPRSVMKASAEATSACLKAANGKVTDDHIKLFSRFPRVVGNICKTPTERGPLAEAGVVRPLLDVLDSYSTNHDVTYAVGWALNALTGDEGVSAKAVADGAMPIVGKILNEAKLRDPPADGKGRETVDPIRHAMLLLKNLVSVDPGMKDFEKSMGTYLKGATDCLKHHTHSDGNLDVVAPACTVYSTVASKSKKVAEEMSVGKTACVGAIIAALAEFHDETDVSQEALDALISVGKASSEAIQQMVKADVAATCVSVIRAHKTNPEIISRALTLLALLARKDANARKNIGATNVIPRVKQILDATSGEVVTPAVVAAAMDLFAGLCLDKNVPNIDTLIAATADGTSPMQSAVAVTRKFIGTRDVVNNGLELALNMGTGKAACIPALAQGGYPLVTGQVLEKYTKDGEVCELAGEVIELFAQHSAAPADACIAAELGQHVVDAADGMANKDAKSFAPFAFRAISSMGKHGEASRSRLQRQPVHKYIAKAVASLPSDDTEAIEALLVAVGTLAMDESGREKFGDAQTILAQLFGIAKSYGSAGKVKALAGWAISMWAFDHQKPKGDVIVDFIAEHNPGISLVEAALAVGSKRPLDGELNKRTAEALDILKNGGRKRKEEEERKRREEEERIRREKEEADRRAREAAERAARELLELKQGYERRYQSLLGAHDDAVATINKLNTSLATFMRDAKARDGRMKAALRDVFGDLRTKERQLLQTESLLKEVHTYSLNFGDKERIIQLEGDIEYWKRKAEEAIRERDDHLRDRKEVEEGLARVAASQRSIADEVKRMKAEKEERDATMERLEDEKRKVQARLIEVQAREDAINNNVSDVNRRKAQIEADEEEMHRRRVELESVQSELAEEQERLDQLRERQRQLEEYYAQLKAREAEVDDAAGTIEERLGRVIAREEAIVNKEIDLERLRRELEQREAAVDDDEKRCDERESRIEEREDTLQEREDDLEERIELFESERDEFLEAKAKFDKRVAELQPQLDALDVREAECRVKEAELAALEDKLNDKQYRLDEMEERLNDKSKALDERETDLESRELRVQKLEKSIAPREAEVSRREDEMRQREEQLDTVEERLDAREKGLKEKEAEFELREMSIREREKDLVAREAEVATKLEDVAAREANVAERADIVQGREQDCEMRERKVEDDERENAHRQKTLDQLASALEQKMEDLELRKKILESQEMELRKKQEEFDLRWKECIEKERDVAAREADFRNREHSIASRETELLKSRKALDDERTALNVLEKQLNDLRRELREREQKLERDNATLLAEKESWAAKRAELEALEESVRDKLRIAQEADERRAKTEAWVVDQEAKIKEKHHELKERQDAVREKEIAADEKLEEAKAIAKKSKAECDAREEALREREKDLEEGLVALKEGQLAVEERLKEIKETEADLSRTRGEIAEMEATIKGKLRKLEGDEEAMAKKQKEMSEAEANLNSNIRNRGDYESDLQVREMAMKDREAQLQRELELKAQREEHERMKMERQNEARIAERVQAAEARLRENLQGQILELEQQLAQLKARGHFDETLLDESDEEESISHLQMTQQLAELKRRMAARREAMQKLRALATSLKGQLEATQKEALLAQVQGDDTKLRQRILAEQDEKIISSVSALEKIAKRKVIMPDNEEPHPWEKMAVAIENVHSYILTLQGSGGASTLANSTAPTVMDGSVKAELSAMRERVAIEDKEKLAASQASDGLYLNPSSLRVANVTQTNATFLWNKSMDAPPGAAYVVYISRDRLNTWTPVVKTKATRWVFDDLTAGNVYFLTVFTVSPKRPPESWKAEILSFPTKKDSWAPTADEPPPRFKIQEHERIYIKCTDFGDNLPVKEDAEQAVAEAKQASAEAAAKSKADAEAASALAKSQAAEAATKKAAQDKMVDEILRA